MFRKYGKVVKKLLTQRFYFYFFRGFPNIVKSTLGLTHPKKWTTHQMNAQKKIKSSCAVVCSEPACFPFNPRLNLRLKVTTTQPLNILQWMIWQSSDLEVMWSAKSKIQWQLYHVIQNKKCYYFFQVLPSVVSYPEIGRVPRIMFFFIWFSKYSGNLFPSSAHTEGGEMNVAY